VKKVRSEDEERSERARARGSAWVGLHLVRGLRSTHTGRSNDENWWGEVYRSEMVTSE
jgi:hypothetical protein